MQSGRICQYSYKRINHLKVRLRRFIIKRDLLKRRIKWDGVGAMPTLANIMEILKNNKLTKYYNNIQQIYCRDNWGCATHINLEGRRKDNRDVSRSREVI